MRTKGKVLLRPKGGSAFLEGSPELPTTTKVFALPLFSISGFSLKHTLYLEEKNQNKSWNCEPIKILGNVFFKLLYMHKSLGDLAIMQILIQKVWGLLFCISTIHFISASSQVMVGTSDSQTALGVAKI